VNRSGRESLLSRTFGWLHSEPASRFRSISALGLLLSLRVASHRRREVLRNDFAKRMDAIMEFYPHLDQRGWTFWPTPLARANASCVLED